MDKENLNKILETQSEELAKAIDTSDLSQIGATDKLVTAQNLEAVITELGDRNIPFYDNVRKVDGQGSGVTFNLNEALVDTTTNLLNAAYADGNVPTSVDSKYSSDYVAYKALGWKGSVTSLARAMGQSIVDLYAREIQNKTRLLLHAIEFMSFWGTGSGNQFKGLDSLITTNVVDANGAAISKEMIDRATARIAMNGGYATHIFSSIRVQHDINNLYNGSISVSLDASGQVDLGLVVPRANTVFGRLPIIGDFFLNPGNTYTLANGSSSAPLGANTSTVFILNMDYIELSFLQRPTLEVLGKTADKEEFFVKAYLALVLRAEKWCAKIINVKDNTLT